MCVPQGAPLCTGAENPLHETFSVPLRCASVSISRLNVERSAPHEEREDQAASENPSCTGARSCTGSNAAVLEWSWRVEAWGRRRRHWRLRNFGLAAFPGRPCGAALTHWWFGSWGLVRWVVGVRAAVHLFVVARAVAIAVVTIFGNLEEYLRQAPGVCAANTMLDDCVSERARGRSSAAGLGGVAKQAAFSTHRETVHVPCVFDHTRVRE
jgi:hypothetical protein